MTTPESPILTERSCRWGEKQEGPVWQFLRLLLCSVRTSRCRHSAWMRIMASLYSALRICPFRRESVPRKPLRSFDHPSPYSEVRSIRLKEYGKNRFSGARLIPQKVTKMTLIPPRSLPRRRATVSAVDESLTLVTLLPGITQ